MDIHVTAEAVDMVRTRGGALWVWAARPWGCCWGTPAVMHAETEQPPGLDGFTRVFADGIEIWFRPLGGRSPSVLDIGVQGRRLPRVEAYWNGLRVAP